MPSFCKQVLSSPPRFFIRGMLGTHVPSATLDCWHFLSPLLGMPAAAQLQATTDTGSLSAPLTSSVSDTPAPQPSIKWQCHSSDQGMPDPGQDEEEAPDNMPEEPPNKSESQWLKLWKRPNERPFLKTLKWWGQPNGPTVRPTRWSSNKKGLMT